MVIAKACAFFGKLQAFEGSMSASLEKPLPSSVEAKFARLAMASCLSRAKSQIFEDGQEDSQVCEPQAHDDDWLDGWIMSSDGEDEVPPNPPNEAKDNQMEKSNQPKFLSSKQIQIQLLWF